MKGWSMGLLDRERATLHELSAGTRRVPGRQPRSPTWSRPAARRLRRSATTAARPCWCRRSTPGAAPPPWTRCASSGRSGRVPRRWRWRRPCTTSRSPAWSRSARRRAAMEWMLLEGIATGNLLLASGFSEGRTDGGILRPTMKANVTDEGVRLTGVKRPCSLARSMDLLTASVQVPRLDGPGDQLAVAMVPAQSEGLRVTPFWSTFALAGAESDQVSLDDVLVPAELLVRTEVSGAEQLDDIQTAGFVWFELLMMGSYLGAASALVERVLDNERVPESERLRLVVDVEGAMAAAENVARQIPSGQRDRAPARRLPLRPLRRAGRDRPRRPPRDRAARRSELHRVRRHGVPRGRRQRSRFPPAVARQDGRAAARPPGRRPARDSVRPDHDPPPDHPADRRLRRPRPRPHRRAERRLRAGRPASPHAGRRPARHRVRRLPEQPPAGSDPAGAPATCCAGSTSSSTLRRRPTGRRRPSTSARRTSPAPAPCSPSPSAHRSRCTT